MEASRITTMKGPERRCLLVVESGEIVGLGLYTWTPYLPTRSARLSSIEGRTKHTIHPNILGDQRSRCTGHESARDSFTYSKGTRSFYVYIHHGQIPQRRETIERTQYAE